MHLVRQVEVRKPGLCRNLPAGVCGMLEVAESDPGTLATRRSADGKSDTVRVKLTPAMVHQIFAEKPHVKRAFQANVPTRIMSHNDFWAKFLRHQLLQQARPRQKHAARI